MMLTFRVLAALLSYPEPELIEALDEAVAILEDEDLVPQARRAALDALITSLRGDDLLSVQERYVALFDRRRSVSLHLYEHVHGESRDRGQAMVRLAELYRLHGLEITACELPDYLPLFLEFLSLVPLAAARSFLAEPLPILAAIESRLAEWRSPYAAVFAALAAVAGKMPSAGDRDTALALIPAEDDDPEALDRVWEEQEVSFMGAGAAGGEGCGLRASTTARRS
jgi:nitrate reductase delta subunit